MFPIHSKSAKKVTEPSVIFLLNGVLILNGKVNKEAGAIFFEIRIPRKKNKKLLQKVPSRSNFIMEKNKNIFSFVNISKYISSPRKNPPDISDFGSGSNGSGITFACHFFGPFQIDMRSLSRNASHVLKMSFKVSKL